MSRRQAAIHREVGYQGVKITAGMDAVIFEPLVEVIPADWVVGMNQDREIGIVGNLFSRIVQAVNPTYALQPLTVFPIDFFTPRKSLVYVFQLQQPQCGVEFAHLAVDTGCHYGDFPHMAEILQLVNAYFSLGIRTNDRATLKGVEHFGGMEAQH